MARNKYPEETERKILEVSLKLFETKGYERTTIADIVQALGMSKGAVYHHFKSKEGIYDRITDLYYKQQPWFDDCSLLPGDTGLEKIQGLFRLLLSDPEKLHMDHVGAMLTKNPRMLALALEASIHQSAPLLRQLIDLGNADGSLHIAHPLETSETFMLLMNLWVGVFSTSREDFLHKLSFLRIFCDNLGFPVFDDALMDVAHRYYDAVMDSTPIQ